MSIMSLLSTNVAVFIVATLICGLTGGYSGYLLKKIDFDVFNIDGKQKFLDKTYLKASILFGIIASFCVPLFIEMTTVGTDKNILNSMLGTSPVSPIPWLIYMGFCLVAAVSGQAFVKRLSYHLDSRLDKLQNSIERDSGRLTEIEVLAQGMRNEIADNRQNIAPPQAPQETAKNLDAPKIDLLKLLKSNDLKPINSTRLASELHLTVPEVNSEIENLDGLGLVSTIAHEGQTYIYTHSEGIAVSKTL